MRTIDIENKDLVLDSKGDIAVATGINAVRLIAEESLRMVRGEWTFDLRRGLPYFTEIFTRGVSLSAVKTMLDSELLGVEGVTALSASNFQYNKTNRSFIYSAIIGTTYGQTEVTVNG